MSESKNTESLQIGGHKIEIDPENLRFSEATLTTYIQTEAGFYDNFGASLAMAERHLQREELLCEKARNDRFVEYKDNGDAVALAEAKAESDPTVMAFKDRVIDAKYNVTRLKRHLLAWDKNHDNAQSLGHMLRKQMDKLHGDIKRGNDVYDFMVEEDFAIKKSSGNPKVDEVVGSFDLDEIEKELAV